MVKKKDKNSLGSRLTCFSAHPIEHRTAQASMIFLGSLLLIIGAAVGNLIVLYDSQNFTNRIIGFILVFAIFISISEIGFKRLTKWSTLKRMQSQQIFGIIVIIMATISATSNLIFNYNILGVANGGLIMGAGGYIILEALR